MKKLQTAGFACLLLWGTLLHAGDIYRWVDEQGNTQMSDVVPPKYRDVATRINSKQYELTPEQKADAYDRARYEAQRAADQKAAALRAQATADAVDRDRRYRAERELARTKAKSTDTSAADNSQRECDAQWRRYNESVACFSRFSTGNVGAGKARFRPEAYQYCTDAFPPSCAPVAR